MITTIKVINTSITSHSYLFCVVRTLKIYSPNNFQVRRTLLLTIVTMLYTRSLEFIPLITGRLYPLINISPSPRPSPSPTTILLSVPMSLTFSDSTCKGVAPHPCLASSPPYPASLTPFPQRARSQSILHQNPCLRLCLKPGNTTKARSKQRCPKGSPHRSLGVRARDVNLRVIRAQT